MTRPIELRVEHLREPRTIPDRHPRFSWRCAEPAVAYELEVLSLSGQVLATSGPVASPECALVEVPGFRAESDTDYAWRVRVWVADADTPGPWAVSRFSTGLFDAADWSAAWVAAPDSATEVERWTMLDWIMGRRPESPPEQRMRAVRILRQSFLVASPITRARLHATSEGVYQARLNDAPVGDEVLAPGFDSYLSRISAQSYDVTQLLREGENRLEVALADGWWAGRIGLTGSSAQFGATTRAIWQLHLDHPDGSRTVVASGGDVMTSRGGWDYADLFVGERFDARRAVGDEGWRQAIVSTGGTDRIRPQRGEPVRRIRELPVVASTPTERGTVYDFGQVIAGRVRLRMRGAGAGDEVRIEHTETLDAAGAWFVNIDGINKEQTDVYVASGAPEEEWEPSFTFHGFRYARISGLRAGATIELTAVVIASDLAYTGELELSDARLDRLHRNVVWSQRGNFLSIPTDCPQRERAGWTGDLQAFIPAACSNAAVVPFVTRWLENLRADQLPDGRIPIMSPYSPFDAESAAAAPGGVASIVACAGWSDAIATVPWTLYERFGDVRVLEENREAIERWIGYQEHTAAGPQFGDWLAPSTLEGEGSLHEKIGIAPALTAEFIVPMFRVRTRDLAARIAAVLGDAEGERRHRARAAELRAAFAAEYLLTDGRLDTALQGPVVLALAFDMVPPERVPGAVAQLVELVEARGRRLDTGFLSLPYLLDVLYDHGHADLARALLWQSESPSWLAQVDAGATTIWENWSAIAPDGTPSTVSLNHYAFGAVDDVLYRRVLGIRPASPGYREALVEPDLEVGLTRARGRVDTPRGPIVVAWRREGDRAGIEVELPVGATGMLRAGGEEFALAAGVSVHEVALG